MPFTCVICQNSEKNLKNIHKTKIGQPAIIIKDLLQQCFEDVDELPNGIGNKAEITSSICVKCENKLLEFYDASMKLALKRKEFQQLLKPCLDVKKPVGNHLWTSDESSDGVREVEDIDWEVEYKPDIEDMNWHNINDESEEDDKESLALIQTRIQLAKADRYCRECDVECPTDQVFQLHMKKVHDKCDDDDDLIVPLQSLNCSECNVELPTEQAYKEHLRLLHKSVGRLKCPSCEKTFNKQSQLNAHQETHFALLCSYCGNSFENKRVYKHHMETQHIDIKQFQCDECGNLYSSLKSLKKHKMVHSDTRNFTCDECPRRFRNSSHLKRHKLTHSGLKPHVCPVCYRTFALKYNMVSHMREHSKPGNLTRRLECANCRQFFTAQQLLNQHLAAGGCLTAKGGPLSQNSETDIFVKRQEDETLDQNRKTDLISHETLDQNRGNDLISDQYVTYSAVS